MLGQRLYNMLGQRLYNMLGQRLYKMLGQRLYNMLGQHFLDEQSEDGFASRNQRWPNEKLRLKTQCWPNFHLLSGNLVYMQDEKTCYDKAGNLPNKGRNFNTQTRGKNCIFLICMISRYWFQTKLLPCICIILEILGQKCHFFHYIINQKRNNFIKHCSPPCTKKPLISEMCIYIKSSLCKWGLGTRGGGTMFYRQKIKGVSA